MFVLQIGNSGLFKLEGCNFELMKEVLANMKQ